MKKAIIDVSAVVLVCALDILPFTGTDVAKLQPVEVLIVQQVGNQFLVCTESGLSGYGESIPLALDDLKLTASGEVFLDTAEYLLLTARCLDEIGILWQYLRPACQVYLLEGEGEFMNLAKYLESHPSDTTLLDCMRKEREIPRLVIQNEVYRLVGQ